MYIISGKALICHETQAGQVHEYPEVFRFVSQVKNYPGFLASQYVRRKAEKQGLCILTVEIVEVAVKRLNEPHDTIDQLIEIE